MPKKTIKEQLIATAGDVIIEAAKFGLDEAGGRILGPTAWKGFKKIMAPVVARLQEKFPALKLDARGDEADPAANEAAAAYLRENSKLEDLLFENFGDLREGQEDIMSSLRRLENLAEKTAQDVASVLELSQQILDEIKAAAPPTPVYELPEWVDVSDTVEQQLMLARVRARRRNEALNLPVAGMIYYSIGAGLFAQRVLEEGKPHRQYKSEIMGAVVTMHAGAKYSENNQVCRKGTLDIPRWGEPERHSVSQTVFCQHEGYWKTARVIEQRQY